MAQQEATTPRKPRGLHTSGAALWESVAGRFELDEHELTVLHQACRTADSLDALQAILDRDGPMVTTPHGAKVHPALVELRQQRIVLARLLAALRIPSDEEQDAGRTQHRSGVRGAYGIRGAVS